MANSGISVWLPKQYGAWAMLLAPALTGVLSAGGRWPGWVVLVAWTTAYLGYMAWHGMQGGRRRKSYRLPVIVYAAVAAGLTVGLLCWRPALLWWGLPLAVLLGGSLLITWRGRERSTVNDACLIGASSLMLAVTATCGRLPSGIGPTGFLTAVSQPAVWLATATMAAYCLGTIPYIKTMIRERGKPGWYAASVVYHLILVGLAILTANPVLIAFSVLLVARAAVVPKVWPRAKPKIIGIGEMVATVSIIIIIVFA